MQTIGAYNQFSHNISNKTDERHGEKERDTFNMQSHL